MSEEIFLADIEVRDLSRAPRPDGVWRVGGRVTFEFERSGEYKTGPAIEVFISVPDEAGLTLQAAERALQDAAHALLGSAAAHLRSLPE